MAALDRVARASQRLYIGDYQAARDETVEVLHDLDTLELPADATGSLKVTRRIAIGVALLTAADAALHLGRGPEAETLAKRRAEVLIEQPQTQVDPWIDSSRARTILAHALVLQGRRDQARAELVPALEYYSSAQRLGARNVTFTRDYARALRVSALAAGADVAGRSQAEASLAKASALINELSAEAKALTDVRQVASEIAATRG
jgi:hypothetical protein